MSPIYYYREDCGMSERDVGTNTTAFDQPMWTYYKVLVHLSDINCLDRFDSSSKYPYSHVSYILHPSMYLYSNR